ncbi:MAG: ribose 5-phosphate isomerase B [Chitinispirillaceae bacterium]|nr:ribose 5-phosphate isomerase B [Chitinispirillaceae bacterium]
MNQNKSSAIVIGSDHAGWELKEEVKKYLIEKGINVKDVSEPKLNPDDDYPKYSKKVAKAVASGEFEKGITVCGTGIGASIAANRVNGARAALCMTPEMARMSRRHNNANVLVMGGRITQPQEAFMIIDAWLSTKFEGGRHLRRVELLDKAG